MVQQVYFEWLTKIFHLNSDTIWTSLSELGELSYGKYVGEKRIKQSTGEIPIYGEGIEPIGYGTEGEIPELLYINEPCISIPGTGTKGDILYHDEPALLTRDRFAYFLDSDEAKMNSYMWLGNLIANAVYRTEDIKVTDPWQLDRLEVEVPLNDVGEIDWSIIEEMIGESLRIVLDSQKMTQSSTQSSTEEPKEETENLEEGDTSTEE